MEHIIWQDSYFWSKEDEQAWIEDAKENCNDDESFDEAEALEWAREQNFYYLDDERDNLNIEVPEDIVTIAKLGLWDGQCLGYSIEDSRKISNLLYSNCDYGKWYCDRYNLRFTGIHHDGTNTYLYRMRKPGISDTQWDNFLTKLYNGEKVNLSRYTVSLLPFIKKVYGF